MATSWDSVGYSVGRRRSRGRTPAVLFVVLLLAGTGAAVYFLFFRDDVLTNGPLVTPTPDSSRPVPGAPVSSDLPSVAVVLRAPDEKQLAKLLRDKQYAEAAEKLEAILPSYSGPQAHRARYLLARCCSELDRKEEAKSLLTKCLEGPDGGAAGRTLGRMAEKEGKPDEACMYYERAYRENPRSKGGRLAATLWAEILYEKYVVRSEKRDEWERIWRLYSAGLELQDGAKRARIVERLEKLIEHVLFSRGHVSPPDVRYTVRPGDVLTTIARDMDVSVGIIRMANGIPRKGVGANRINPGQTLKVIKRKISIVVRKSAFRLTVLADGCFLRDYRIGIGSPDDPTMAGEYVVKNRTTNPRWRQYDYGDPNNPLGTRWIGLHWTGRRSDLDDVSGMGIHGSNPDGDGIGGMQSLGCVRMWNRDVEELFELVRADPDGLRGTRVIFLE